MIDGSNKLATNYGEDLQIEQNKSNALWLSLPMRGRGLIGCGFFFELGPVKEVNRLLKIWKYFQKISHLESVRKNIISAAREHVTTIHPTGLWVVDKILVSFLLKIYRKPNKTFNFDRCFSTEINGKHFTRCKNCLLQMSS